MLLEKLLWITNTRAHPVLAGEKPSSHIAISVLQADKPISGDIEDGFCVQPQSDYARKLKVDDILSCGTQKSSWTMSHLKSMKAVENVIKQKDLPGLLSLKQAIELRMPRKTLRKSLRKYRKM